MAKTTPQTTPPVGRPMDIFWTDEDDHVDEKIQLSRDLVVASRSMGDEEARYLVDAYYMTQENRKRTDNQTRSLGDEPHALIGWLSEKNRTLENQVARALDNYTLSHPMGDWMRGIVGIGPVLSAGLLAHIYMGHWCVVCQGHNPADCQARQNRKKWPAPPHEYQPGISLPTVGHIWQFAGIAGDGQKPWEKGMKRPFNATLKVICWKVGQSFMKLSNKEACFYGHIYRQRKAYEVANNEGGRLAEQAARCLPHFKPTTESYGWYKKGMLPPAHIDARARRYAVKLFLSHLHGEWHQRKFGIPAPLPYPIAFGGHAHLIHPPQPHQPQTPAEPKRRGRPRKEAAD
jgi:hypothetical protein